MSTTTSSDGTTITFECIGSGPPVVLVDGALCYRDSGPSRPLATELSRHFSVYTYDRRGRGESTDTPPYAVEREVDDIAAVVKEAGGAASVYGISSGAALALEAANAGCGIDKLALYEAPFIVDSTHAPVSASYVEAISTLASTDPSGAVKAFLRQVGVPGFGIAMMRLMPVWSKLKGVAHTLPYDTALTAPFQTGAPLPSEQWASITVPTLVVAGSKSPAWMHNAQRAVADVVPGATFAVLEGQNHMVKAPALAPMLTTFFRG